VSVTTVERWLHAGVLLAFLGLALYFPYWWFGVVPFVASNDIPQSKIDELLADKRLPDFYAEPLSPISAAEYAAQKEAFTWCRFCHTLAEGEENRVGPNLYRIFGKPAAVLDSFPYSGAFIEARENGLIWTPETIQAFIADPAKLVPGNRMRYPPMVGYEDNPERQRRMYEYLLRETR
jgi:cytochrome c2